MGGELHLNALFITLLGVAVSAQRLPFHGALSACGGTVLSLVTEDNIQESKTDRTSWVDTRVFLVPESDFEVMVSRSLKIGRANRICRSISSDQFPGYELTSSNCSMASSLAIVTMEDVISLGNRDFLKRNQLYLIKEFNYTGNLLGNLKELCGYMENRHMAMINCSTEKPYLCHVGKSKYTIISVQNVDRERMIGNGRKRSGYRERMNGNGRKRSGYRERMNGNGRKRSGYSNYQQNSGLQCDGMCTLTVAFIGIVIVFIILAVVKRKTNICNRPDSISRATK